MSDAACDLLPADLIERSEGRHEGTLYWRLHDASAVLAACRDRRLLPIMYAVVAVRDGAVDVPSESESWGMEVRDDWIPRDWGTRVASAVSDAEQLVRRAIDLADEPDHGELLFVLRPVSREGQGHSPLGRAFVATFIAGPFVLFGAMHLVSRAVLDLLFVSILTVIGSWIVGACLISGVAFFCDHVAKRRLRSEERVGDAPRRAATSSADAPRLVAHIAIVFLLAWVWSPMGASLIALIAYVR